ncbi:MAG: flagellar hook-associated protein FlgL [Sulfurospirillum sp.]|nr:flagellar hook-associated protein FlgL [Sulfurospirillum sp.]
MRITNALFYQNAKNDHQKSMRGLYDINTQLASGVKIQNSYEDSGVFVDTMRLNYEVATLEQVKETSSKAQTFANNTDGTLNQVTSILDQFKTKMIQSANEVNSPTSLNALANDMEAMLTNLKSIANTSINGQFLFSGSALDVKPIQANGTYNGNDQNLEAIVGSGVQIPYNITGKDLFLGRDSDYNKVLSTNVKMLDLNKLHPEVMQDTNMLSEEVYLNENNTIRDMVGDTDADTSNDPMPVFYLSGKKSDGENFATKFELSTTSKISDLLERIAYEYGNTGTNKVVDVGINAHGQIEITDLKKGNTLLQMHLFAAIDRNATGVAGNGDKSNTDELLAQPNVDIIEFTKSNFSAPNTASSIASRQDIFNQATSYVGYPMKMNDGSFVKTTTLLNEFMPSNVDHIDVNGINIATTTTVQSLMDEIQTQFGGTARLENGQIIVDGLVADVILIAKDLSGSPVSGFQIVDAMNFERKSFVKDGNELLGNVSQFVKKTGEYASASTKLIEVAGVDSLDTKQFILNGKDKNGNNFNAQIDFSNGINGATFSLDKGSTNFTIFNAQENPTKADEMTYQQLLDVVSMITSGILPTDTDSPLDGIQADEYNAAIISAQNNVAVTLDYKGRMQLLDTQNSVSKIEFAMYDINAKQSSEASALSFMANDAIVIDEPDIDFFKDLNQMIEAVRSGGYRMDASAKDPRNIGIQNSLFRVDHLSDHIIKAHTKIGSYSNALMSAQERAELLSVNVKTVRSQVIDVDLAEAYMQFQQLSNSYQAMLSTVSKINSMSLLNYM